MNNDTGVYAITSPSGKQYIGSAISFKNRWREHRRQLRNGEHHSKPLQRAWDKYGGENFVFDKIALCSVTDLIAIEQSRINSIRPEYNVLPNAGSRLGYSPGPRSIETRMKHSASTKGVPKSKEHIAAVSRAKTGVKRKPFDEAWKRALGDVHRGEKSWKARACICIETGQRFGTCKFAAEWLREIGRTTAQTTDISAACGRKQKHAHGYHWRYESDFDPNEKFDPIKPHRRRVLCIETGTQFISCNDAARWLRENGRPKATFSHISSTCSGRLERAYGYTWRYAD